MNTGTWVKAGILSASVIAAFSFPIFPSTWAKPSAVKIMHDEIHHAIRQDFKGTSKNVLMQEEGKKIQLTVHKEGEPAVYTSQVIESKINFTDVGAHWLEKKQAAHDAIQVELRTSKDKQTWTDWKEVHADHQQGPDFKKSEETFTDLLLGQRGKYIQYRIMMHTKNGIKPQLQDFNLTLINSEDGEEIAYDEHKSISLTSLLIQKAEAAMGKPPIVSRSEWGADESLRFNSDGTEKWPRVYDTPVTHMIVHHTDTPNDDLDPAARVRSIYYYHTVTRGWGDIGYNAIIGSDGRIYEGRHGKDGEVLTSGVVGGHAYSFNYHSFGVALMGNYSLKSVPDNMRNSLVDLLSYVADVNDIDPNTTRDYIRNYSYSDPHVPQTDPNVPTITGHGLLPRSSTDCPGEFNREDLISLRNLVSNQVAQDPIIIDNDDAGTTMVGSWATSTYSSQRYGADYLYSSKGTGEDTFTWNFDLPATGSYHVYVWYSAGSNRATNAPYTIYSKTGAVTQTVNQQENGGRWVDLGVYDFSGGPNKVTLSDNADNLVIADAVKLEHVPSQDQHTVGALVDDSSPSEYIAATPSLSDWPSSSNVKGAYGGSYRPHAPGKGATFTWKLSVPEAGDYDVYVHYTAATDRATNAPYTIHYSGGQTITKRVNQRINGGQWVHLGSYPFDQGMSPIVLSDDADGYVIADAVKLVKQ